MTASGDSIKIWWSCGLWYFACLVVYIPSAPGDDWERWKCPALFWVGTITLEYQIQKKNCFDITSTIFIFNALWMEYNWFTETLLRNYKVYKMIWVYWLEEISREVSCWNVRALYQDFEICSKLNIFHFLRKHGHGTLVFSWFLEILQKYFWIPI